MATAHLTDEQLSAQLDGALSGDESMAVTGHLATCDDCTARMDRLRATSQAVANLPAVEMPRPLDLGFLRDLPRQAIAEGERGFVARVIHGRTPAWVPTAMAFAAVLVVAINVAPRLLPGGGAPSQTSAGLGLGAVASSAPNSDKSVVDPQATAPGALAPGAGSFAQSGIGVTAQKAITGPDGSTVTIVANPQAASAGHPIQVVLRLVGGPSGTTLSGSELQLFVVQGANQTRLAGSVGSGRRLSRGEELDLTTQWSAGALSGPPTAGAYTLIGRVFLADGRIIEVTLPFLVSAG